MTGDTINIKVGSQTFKVNLSNHHSAKAFKEILPLTVAMADLNENEKYGDLLKSLPANAECLKTIENGDLMLYGSKTLVLFYKTFQTSYNYIKLSSVNNAVNLATALGSKNLSITFGAE